MPNLPYKTLTINGTIYEVSKAVVTFVNLTYVGLEDGNIKFSSDLAFNQALADFKAGKSIMVHTDYLAMFGDIQITESLDGTKLEGVGNLSGQLVGYKFYPYFNEQTQQYDYNTWVCARSYFSGTSVTVTPVLTSGTKIATVDVDGVETDLYAPAGGGGGGSAKVLEFSCMNWNSGGDPGARLFNCSDYSSWNQFIAGIKAGDAVFIKILDFNSQQELAYIRLDNIVVLGNVSKVFFTAYSGLSSQTYQYKLENSYGSDWATLSNV